MDIQAINRTVITQFRAGGPVEGMNRDGLLLLTTVGRRTGLRRTTPMMFERDADDLLVIASNVGAPRHPDWYFNLVQEPHVKVEVGLEEFEAVAETTTGARRERVWSMLKERYPFFAEHEAKTTRTIPVVALTRVTR
jgi:deazaflavin-dependent oxidoreductase (nitroreductase family)